MRGSYCLLPCSLWSQLAGLQRTPRRPHREGMREPQPLQLRVQWRIFLQALALGPPLEDCAQPSTGGFTPFVGRRTRHRRREISPTTRDFSFASALRRPFSRHCQKAQHFEPRGHCHSFRSLFYSRSFTAFIRLQLPRIGSTFLFLLSGDAIYLSKVPRGHFAV